MISGVIWLYSLVSVLIISLISLIGIFSLKIKIEKLKQILIYFISFSAGALLGDAFIHLIPSLFKESSAIISALTILLGIILFFILEKVIHWRHCHMPITKEHVHPLAYMNLVGDALHNFIDGLIIAGSYLINIQVGIATTLAVILHEIPQEIGDFGVLLHAGLKRTKALFLNFVTGLTAVLGTIIALVLTNYISNLQFYITGIAIGGFIYIAGSDLIPEMHKEVKLEKSILQLVFLILGILVMLSLLLLE
ncbi:MAG: ZIP family metal transporter [Candidatus Nanoarchaeia archaeon]